MIHKIKLLEDQIKVLETKNQSLSQNNLVFLNSALISIYGKAKFSKMLRLGGAKPQEISDALLVCKKTIEGVMDHIYKTHKIVK